MTNVALLAALGYAALLFLVAFICDRSDRRMWFSSPLVYTLSISIYCTSWTFYGAVGSAARSGLEYLTIYLGPTLVFFGFWGILRKMLRISKRDNITSIADFLSSRYAKSDRVAAIVTLMAVVAAAPYIALQIKAIATSYQLITEAATNREALGGHVAPQLRVEMWITAGLALFTILFGTRTVDIQERHFGVVAAIALEALVKLTAIIGVGLLAVFEVGGGPDAVLRQIGQSMPVSGEDFGVRWFGLIVLSGIAILCLPRQFQVTIVENDREDHLYTASWMFPLYLFLMSIFILPVAIIGQETLPAGANPDMFMLTMPIAAGRDDIALLAFLGGFSSGTSMVIVSCIALSTMISNHILMPLALRTNLVALGGGGDVRRFLLTSRRFAICVILGLGFLYLRLGTAQAELASIGLIAFVGVAQIMPSLFGALYWRLGNRRGAMLGLSLGFATWAYCLLLPGTLAGWAVWDAISREGLFGWFWLRPTALFGAGFDDPLMHALFWSLALNIFGFVAGSLSRLPTPNESLQAEQFVDVFGMGAPRALHRRSGSADTLFDLAQRIMGADRAYGIFRNYAVRQGATTEFPVVDDAFIDHLEKTMAASVGAASASVMIQRATGSERISLDELVKIADETARLMRHSTEVERKSSEIEEAARQLRAANERLRDLDRQKDEFLSQVSHELRTPMTSIRSFTEILSGAPDLTREERQHFVGIVHAESIRLTHLLDEILDMNVVERGDADLPIETIDPELSVDRALDACLGIVRKSEAELLEQRARSGALVRANASRLSQVFINLLSNALKYNNTPSPRITLTTVVSDGWFRAIIADNGPGIDESDREKIFGKFARGRDTSGQQGAGLGLAISRTIVERFGGTLSLLPADGQGARFEVRLRCVTP